MPYVCGFSKVAQDVGAATATGDAVHLLHAHHVGVFGSDCGSSAVQVAFFVHANSVADVI